MIGALKQLEGGGRATIVSATCLRRESPPEHINGSGVAIVLQTSPNRPCLNWP